jgi:hypothetical protein
MIASFQSREGEPGPWNPGIQSQIPAPLRHLSTILRPENVSTRLAEAIELQQLTGLPLADLVALRPERLLLHEVLIRVTADLSVPDGSRIEDLGVNFREMTTRLLQRHLEPRMSEIVAAHRDTRQRLAAIIETACRPTAESPATGRSAGRLGLLARLRHVRRAPASAAAQFDTRALGPERIPAWEQAASRTSSALECAALRSLAKVVSALFATHGCAWGARDMVVSLAATIACNTHGSDVIGDLIEPWLLEGAAEEGYALLPRQERPVVINTKGPSASGKSSLRPLQRQLAGKIGVQWTDFALISPDIWRKQLLEYSSLGSAYKYAGAFTSEELQIVDQKLDRYMARKQRRGTMPHLLIDRFRFDSFAPDSDEAGSNLLTRFGHSLYLFFMITPPELLVERAWKRGLEVGRYKAVDDTLAHSVEAYVGIPDVFFTWVRRSDKNIHFEFLDNSVRLGELPRTVAFGTNSTINVLDVAGMLDIVRYGQVNIDAAEPGALYPDPAVQSVQRNVVFLERCLRSFEEINFADADSGRVYLRMQSGRIVLADRHGLAQVCADSAALAVLRAVVPSVFDPNLQCSSTPAYVGGEPGQRPVWILGHWGGRVPQSSQPRKSQ